MEPNKNPMEIRSKIISLLKIRGPALPVHITKETGLNMIFAGAFLSELASDRTIIISNMKVGGSPLYFLPGQEQMLENFIQHLPGKEKEAFSLLKEKKLLEDKKLEPAIRVAIRNMKDFAFPLLLNSPEQILFWRFYSVSEEEAKLMVEKIIESRKPVEPIATKIEPKPGVVSEIKIKPATEIKQVAKTKPAEIKAEIKAVKKEIEKPLIIIKEKPIKTKEKSDFVKKIVSFLESENIELIEEKELKKKEVLGIIRINSDIGKIRFLLIAKEKKTITENDLTLALQKSQSLKMPAFLLSSGSLDKKASSYLEQYASLIKFRRI